MRTYSKTRRCSLAPSFSQVFGLSLCFVAPHVPRRVLRQLPLGLALWPSAAEAEDCEACCLRAPLLNRFKDQSPYKSFKINNK